MILKKVKLFNHQRKWKKELVIALNQLKELGFYPKNILDIGAQYGQWTKIVRKKVFYNSFYQLIEPISYKELKIINKNKNTSCLNILLSDEEKEVLWYEKKNGGDSIYKENTQYYKNCNGIKKNTIKLDDVKLSETEFQLIKIDTQGSEIPIIKGGLKIFSKAEFILLEIPFFGEYNRGVLTFREHIESMEVFGFIPYNIISLQRITGNILIQVDMLFVNKKSKFVNLGQEHIKNLGIL